MLNDSTIVYAQYNLIDVATGDTMLVHVQHYGPGAVLHIDVLDADAVMSCYPELLPPLIRRAHVLPHSRGRIWVYQELDSGYMRVFDECGIPDDLKAEIEAELRSDNLTLPTCE